MRKIIVLLAVAMVLFAGCADTEETPPATATDEPVATADGVSAGGDCMDATKAEGQADLETQDFVFAPPCLIISTSQGLRLHNEGDVKHNFSVKGFAGLDIDVEPGQENNTEALGLDPGSYDFSCKYHAEQGMKGKLQVKAG
jgi:plastocyanin